MMEKENPVKKYIFEQIKKNEEAYMKLMSKQKYAEIINSIISNCNSVMMSTNKEDNLRVLATGILHYLLTNSAIPSQRKIIVKGIELGIVIPDLKTLKKDPKKSLIILIPETMDKISIEEQIQNISNLQPQRENIWLVLTKNIPIANKSFIISDKETSFSQIIYEIGQFANINCQNKFNILRI